MASATSRMRVTSAGSNGFQFHSSIGRLSRGSLTPAIGLTLIIPSSKAKLNVPYFGVETAWFEVVLSRLRSGLWTHLCGLSLKSRGLPDSICLHVREGAFAAER
jgi:hypothetical protein